MKIQQKYEPLAQPDSFLTGILPHDFILCGMPCWFNEHFVSGSEFDWKEIDEGTRCPMALINTKGDWGENNNLYVPDYGLPIISESGGWIKVIWQHQTNPADYIELRFQEGSNKMTVISNPLGLISPSEDPVTFDMITSVYDDGTGEGRYFVPLYAILNQVNGGVMYNPFGGGPDDADGDGGMAFAYSGDAIQGYSGYWETSNDENSQVDAVIGGKKVSVGDNWWSLELRPNGTFVDSHLYYKIDKWEQTVTEGEYAYFGRVLAMKSTSMLDYAGEDIENLSLLEPEPSQNSDLSGATL